ncbi:major urinary protein 5 [Tupaia chinensis]|uniref:major urinary protein 5 n=1 Tax=Tupaia chinensis TaxID=246437 RepID=UPI0003C90925|nr:major urinary protein 5 [Tupaia chinensis]
MKLLLLCLGLTLVCAHHTHDHDEKQNFDIEKISGSWYSILTASDNKEKIGENSPMRIFVEHIDLLKNSSLSVKFHTKANGKCTGHYLICNPTEKDGVFSVGYNGLNTFCIVDTDYDSYVTFHTVNENYEGTFHILEIFGRNEDLSPHVKEKFVQLCEKYGIPEENVVDLTNEDRCLEARDGEVFEAFRLVISDSGRNEDLSPHVKEKFVQLCEKYGIPEENVVDLTNEDRCLEARDGEVFEAFRLVISDSVLSDVSSRGFQHLPFLVTTSFNDKFCDLICITITHEGIVPASSGSSLIA